ncbi:MAG TPA: hypothetical protein VK841_25950 [Polyangiaceae bacterium]|nr:hypothetical protein [Polyangiaceae bacterium]
MRIRVVSIDRHYSNAEDMRHFSRGQGEYVRLSFALYDKCRDSSQGGLLVSQPREVLARLGVGDRGRHELRERGDSGLGVLGQWFHAAGRRHQHAPEPPLGEDRGADHRA